MTRLCGPDQRGLAMSIEAALIVPALLLFIGLLLTLARVAIAEQHVGVAASAGARAASLERSGVAGERAARTAVAATLAERNVTCRDTLVRVDAEGLGRPLGERGTVSVSAACSVELRDIGLPLIPGAVEVTASRTSPVDPLRGK